MVAPTQEHEFIKVPIPADLAQRKINLTDNARTVLQKRYLRRGDDGKPVETEQEMFWRVAYHVALAEESLGGDDQQVEYWARRFFDLLTHINFFPNSPTFTGAGTPLGQLAACFVLKIEDDMGRTGSGIFETLRHAALIQQTGGGNGFSFSQLRPKGALVKSSNGTATGPVGFLKVYDQAFGEIAQGGCLTADTLVFTEDGLLRLDEIVTHNFRGWQPQDLHVSTDTGMRISKQAYNNGVVPVLKLTTTEGVQVTGTPNHKFKVISSDGPTWKRLDELQTGDAILVKLGQHQGKFQALQLPEKRHGNQVMPTLRTTLDEELAFFLGYMVGNGFVGSTDDNHRVGVTVAHDNYLITEMPSLMTRLFGKQITVHRQQKENDPSVTFVIDNQAVKEYLMLNGLAKAKSTQVQVPRLIRQSPSTVVGAFLRGLFEADGTVSHHYPQLLSSSEMLIREVATLLIGLGCPIRVAQHPLTTDRFDIAPLWFVRITSHIGLQAWRENIGGGLGSSFVEYSDFSSEATYRLPYAKEPVFEVTTMPQIDKRDHATNLTVSAYTNLKEDYTEFAEYAHPLDDLWFVTVESIKEAGEALTLDIEVDENHTYIANGLTSHNSRRGANMAVLRIDHPDIREFIKCKSSEGSIANFNISVGITDEFMRCVEEGKPFDLINPQNGEVWETVDARELFAMIVKYAHHNGEPGVLFLDAANRENPVPHLYELESTNPCVAGDTLVATPTGWQRVDEIKVGDEICTILGTGQVETIEINDNMPVYAVKFSDGGSIRVTASHQFHVYNLSTFEPKRLEDLKIGDWVRVYEGVVEQLPEMVLAAGREPTEIPAGYNLIDGIWAAQVMSIEADGIETVYDLYEPTSDTWITNGYVSRGCGEQWLGPFENCCLGSINLATHVTEDGHVDWEKLAETTALSTRFLDDVVTANQYVPVIPQLREAAEKVRRIGLGIMGLADMMYMLGVRYGSKVGQEFASQVMEFVRYHSMKTSIELAEERGAFPAIEGSRYDPNDLKWTAPKPIVEHTTNWGRPTLAWKDIEKGLRKHGIRNGAQNTIAPTGTLSTISGIEGYGCEPVFALAYMRYVNENMGNSDKRITLQYTSPQFEKALRSSGLSQAEIDQIVKEVNEKGTCQHIEAIPEAIRNVFVVAGDITVDEHIWMQAAMQAHVDNSISKTINAPAHATEDDVAKAYLLGWKLGCKGLTVYVTGSRDQVVLETAETKKKREGEIMEPVVIVAEPQKLFREMKKPRPNRLVGKTYRLPTPVGTTYITINENGDGKGQPFEVFIHTAKAGSEIAAVSEAIGRLISLVLRLTSTASPRERVEEMIRQLEGIGGGRQLGFGPTRVSSLPDAIAQILREYMEDSEEGYAAENDLAYPSRSMGEQIPLNFEPAALPAGNGSSGNAIGDICPECGDATLIREEGCLHCYTCGYSEC